MRVFISAGEASGDAYGAALATEMRRLSPLVPREEFVSRVVTSRHWPRNPEGAAPTSSSEKTRRDFAELLGYDLEEFVPSDFPEYQELEHAPWEEIPGKLYDLLRRSYPQRLTPHTYHGVGGRRMRDADIQLAADSGAWGAISITQSLKVVPRVLGGYFAAREQLRSGPPGLFVPIDFGFANIRLAKIAKGRGWKVLYFVPPGSWRRDRQGMDLPLITDAISTPFEWSAKILQSMGANAYWFGHPIKQLLRGAPPTLPAERQGIAVLPGSRGHEIAENLPLIAQSVRELGIKAIEFALAPTVDLTAFRREWARLAPGRKNDRFVVGATGEVLGRARSAIVCSGTATLEAALLRCPMVVVYRVSRAVVMEAKLLRIKRPKFIALPNILLDRTVVPELVQDEATPQTVSAALREIHADGSARQSQLTDFDELDRILGSDDAITRTAELALSLLKA